MTLNISLITYLLTYLLRRLKIQKVKDQFRSLFC